MPASPLTVPHHIRAAAAAPKSWLLIPIAIFMVARLVSAILLEIAGDGHPGQLGRERVQIPVPSTLLNLHTNWDGQWYKVITEQGYPRELPRDATGTVRENPWAFFPAYPILVRIAMLTGLPFAPAGILVSYLCGAIAMVFLFRLIARGSTVFTASVTVTAISFSPAALAFGVTYSESLALALILISLTFIADDRPWAFLISGLLLAFTRPISPALAAVSGLMWLIRFWKRDERPFLMRDRLTWAAVTGGVAISFLAWPGVVAWSTGELDAYALTQRAWYDPGDQWTTWLTSLLLHDGAWIVAAPVLLGAVLVAARYGRNWPLALRLWVVMYPLFILAVSRPTSSIFRYLTLTGPAAWPFPALTDNLTSRSARVWTMTAVVVGGCLLQYLWIRALWVSESGLFP